MKNKNNPVQGTILLITAQGILLLSGLTVHLFLARKLGPSTYGTFGVIISLLLWIEIVINSAVPTAIKKYISENESQTFSIFKKGLRIQIIFSLSVFVIFVLASRIIALILKDSTLTKYLFIAAIDIPIYGACFTYLAVLNARRRFKIQMIGSSVYGLGRLGIIWLLVSLNFSLYGALIGNILGSLLALIVGIIFINSMFSKEKFPLSNFESSKIINFAKPYAVLGIIYQLIMCIDILCIKSLLQNPSLTGFYTSARTISRMPAFLILGLTYTAFPFIVRHVTQQDKEKTRIYLERSIRFFFIVMIPIIFLVTGTSRQLIELIFGSQYIPAHTPLRILVIAHSAFALFSLLLICLLAESKLGKLIKIVIIILTIDLALNIILIPRLGMIGAAISTLISGIVTALWVGIIIHRRFSYRISISSLFKIILSSLIILTISIYFKPTTTELISFYILAYLFYMFILFLLKELTREDILRFKNGLTGRVQT